MGADVQDIIAKLMMQQSQQQNQGPSLFGLQAQQDPNATAALLSKLQQQQYVNQQGNDNSEWGFINNAGKKDFARAGQGIAGMLGIGTPAPMDNSAVMAQRGAIQQGKSDLSDALAQPGTDPRQAQIDVLSKLAQAGVPGAADALEKASDALEKTKVSNSQIDKNSSQAAAARDEINARAAAQKHAQFEEGGQTWHYVSTNDGIAQYVNDHGEPKVVTIQPSKTIAAAAPDVDPAQVATLVQAIKDGRMKPVDPSGTFAKTPMGTALLLAQAKDPTIEASSYGARVKAVKDFTTGTQGNAINSFNVALSHLDVLGKASDALNNSDMPAVNKALNAIGKQAGGTSAVTFNAIKGIVGDEIVKTIVPGQSAVGDREEIKAQIDAASTPAALKSVISNYQSLMAGKLAGLRTQYENAGLKNFEGKLQPRSIAIARAAPEYNSIFPVDGAAPAEAAPAPKTYNPATGKVE